MQKPVGLTAAFFCFLVAFAPSALAQGTYTQIDYPGATRTEVFGINTVGDIVGEYVDTSGIARGFLLSGTTFTTLDSPGAVVYTVASGINDVGQIVGSDDTGGFLYDVATQTFAQFSNPRPNSRTFAEGINNAGTIVGGIQMNGLSGRTIGFELTGTKYAKVIYPKPYIPTEFLESINNSGESVGYATTTRETKGFRYIQHKFAPIVIPGIPNAVATSLNDEGAVAGCYESGFTITSFVYQNGNVQQLEFPGAVGTCVFSINNSGQVVGWFYGSDNVYHGFTWTPSADVAKQ